MSEKKKVITKEIVQEAMQTLLAYKKGKSALDNRIIDEDDFWNRRQWEKKDAKDTPPASSWLFNSIVNKHADAMDSFPELKCLPREESDEESAKSISSIFPVILERNNFRRTYSQNWWYKLKHGTACYGVFWDSSLENGLGDVQVSKIDLLNIFWEPGITDIQKSKNLFIISTYSTEELKELYPKANFTGGDKQIAQDYNRDDALDNSDKTTVIDWYYKKRDKEGRTILHFCKFAENEVLFASENEKGYEKGWYEHGKYPVVFDVLYPSEGTPTGFGIISVAKNAQLYIDRLDNAIMENAMKQSKPRYLSRLEGDINETEFLDWSKPIVHVAGSLDENHLRQININPINGYIMNFREFKVDELKETSNSRDFSQGGTSGGVTSGAAIATLMEAGNKTSRDTINESYNCQQEIGELIIELMRQFYTEQRSFRITGEDNKTKYTQFSNENIVEQSIGSANGEEQFRRPIFDIIVRAQKNNPYSTLSNNETAMNLYNMGFFAPQNADAALAALKIMDFDGKREVEDSIKNGQTMAMQLAQAQQEIARLQGVIANAAAEQEGVMPGAVPAEASGIPAGAAAQM